MNHTTRLAHTRQPKRWPTPSTLPFACTPAARAAALLWVGLAAASVAHADDTPQRIEITGSSIKRIEGETALPVQVIKREDIDKTGATTAAELLKTISANTAPLSDGASITDGTSGQRGFNGANLRGLGVSSTLVLLNGRRLANFATPGDNAGVDLNNIPAGAIARVEVLKDGASAIYGTDAIGGVINFITRKDYQGADLGLSAAATQEGGAGKRTATISAGAGDLTTDRFNVFGVLDLQQLDALRSSQRKFIQDRPLASTLPALMSSNTFPANVDLSADQRDALIAAGIIPAGSGKRVNPSAPGCNPPATVYAPQGPGGANGCSYDYMEDTEIYPKSSKIGFLGRATFQLTDDHQLFAELMQTQAVTDYVLSPNPQRVRNLPVTLLPQSWQDAFAAAGQPADATFSGIRYRMSEAGNRTNRVTSTGSRVVLGASGSVSGWDYDTALSWAQNQATDRYNNGYVLFDQLDAGIRDGRINPFGPSSAAGRDLLSQSTVHDDARKSKGTTEGIDGKVTHELATLSGGPLAMALGAEYRRESQDFTPSALLTSNNIAGDRDPSGLATALAATHDARHVYALYTELDAPVTKELELQFALRHDHYSDAGGTTNPKLGIRWQPSKALLVRASAATGFRAPSLYDLHGPTTYGSAASFLTDPQCVAELGDIDACTDQFPVTRKSNPNLKPETSQQFSLGFVVEPSKQSNLSLDYWNIQKKDVISTLGEQIIVESPDKYNGVYITRDPADDTVITDILLQKENQGRLKTSGLDVGGELRSDATPYGRFSVSLNGTYILEYKRQFGPLEPYRSNLGVFLNDQVVQRWRHRLSFGWDYGPVSMTLANQYLSGYTDQNTTYDPVSNSLLPHHEVSAYSLWDLTGSWDVTKELKLRAGVLNLLNTAPPFSNQAYYFLATYDPTYTDPRGRSYYLSLQYKFR